MWFKEWYGKTARLALLLINYLGIGIIQLFSFSHEEKGERMTPLAVFTCAFIPLLFSSVFGNDLARGRFTS